MKTLTRERVVSADAKPAPQRICRSRAKGWRLPGNAVVVTRPTGWGNPFVTGIDGTQAKCVELYRLLLGGFLCISNPPEHVKKQEAAHAYVAAHLHELRGKDLACWCRIGTPCHADVLLTLANHPDGDGR